MTWQYFKPEKKFAGDAMPFFHQGIFHVYYLLDENHHQSRNGLGGHQWAHLSTKDLVDWQEHPVAIPITEDWEGSICTGSVFYHDGLYHAFYATRKTDRTQHLSHAVSEDGVTFRKTHPNPFLSPPAGFSPYHFRDPFVFQSESGNFLMLVTAMKENPGCAGQGCVLRLTSRDLWAWQAEEPFYLLEEELAPECPEYFVWNQYHYLLFSLNLATHYRISDSPFGPWLKPEVDILGCRLEAVMRTAPFSSGRRLGVAWLGTRVSNLNHGEIQWAGQLVFREIIQLQDGYLGTRFIPEMMPETGQPIDFSLKEVTPEVQAEGQQVKLSGTNKAAEAKITNLPAAYRLNCLVVPGGKNACYGLVFGQQNQALSASCLRFNTTDRTVHLGKEGREKVEGLTSPFSLDIIVIRDIIDVEIGRKRCLINRLPEGRGISLTLFARNGEVTFKKMAIRPIKGKQ
ncbi:MAG: hypothetical protein NC911_00150 [Candidatus Omnitrophica bacterium]|nr:hypothetical protein [Candidatus Omnitrophota bacterium]